ncbi:putative peroxisomal biogenesis factor 11 [Helianthus anomalus]
MTTLDVARTELALTVLYLNKAEARDKILLSNTFVNDLHALINPTALRTPLPLVLLGKVIVNFSFSFWHFLINYTLFQSKNALSTFLFLEQIVWLHRSGIYKNKEHAEIIGRVSLFCWMGCSLCTTLVEIGELGRLSKSVKKFDKDLKGTDTYKVCVHHQPLLLQELLDSPPHSYLVISYFPQHPSQKHLEANDAGCYTI